MNSKKQTTANTTSAPVENNSVEQFRKYEMIDFYVEDLERLARENGVTLNYYIKEFIC